MVHHLLGSFVVAVSAVVESSCARIERTQKARCNRLALRKCNPSLDGLKSDRGGERAGASIPSFGIFCEGNRQCSGVYLAFCS